MSLILSLHLFGSDQVKRTDDSMRLESNASVEFSKDAIKLPKQKIQRKGFTPSENVTVRDSNNPKVLARIDQFRDVNISSKKALFFNYGPDKTNPRIGSSKIEKIGLEIENSKNFDTLEVVEYTLKDGKKIGGITVAGFKGNEEKFRNLMREIIGAKANVGNCIFDVGSFKETDKAEIYTIFFDLD